jgi:hypothetical protein
MALDLSIRGDEAATRSLMTIISMTNILLYAEW